MWYDLNFQVDCYLQAGTQDFSANLFPNQFNIGLNIEAASFILKEYEQFASFAIIPSATAQSLKYSLVGLQRVGHKCLGKKILSYNAKVKAKDIVLGDHTIEKDFPNETASMPDLTTFLCVLKGEKLGVVRSYVEVVYSIEEEVDSTVDNSKNFVVSDAFSVSSMNLDLGCLIDSDVKRAVLADRIGIRQNTGIPPSQLMYGGGFA
ncbi:unnamed protein product [Clonostachys rosea f. rosea IK726]|uniref:Uncharacterized protein n=1 Tax=Clonostachys rosea f. rosea IK726 TaxID=1349383 RepID=A0ACA9UR76_BIOOC|nr:unnamed protein product [Clonostachys rosea f. rosea IK726]